jgi:hypothetical protein
MALLASPGFMFRRKRGVRRLLAFRTGSAAAAQQLIELLLYPAAALPPAPLPAPARPLPPPPGPAAPKPDRRAPRRSEAAAAARRTAAGEIVIAAATRGRLLSPRAGPLRAAHCGRLSDTGTRRLSECEGTGTEEAARPRRRSDALRRGCLSGASGSRLRLLS